MIDRDRVRDLALALGLGCALFLPGLGDHDLWNPDEPRYVEVAREMREAPTIEHLLVPRLNGEIYAQKPPLLFWLIALGAAIAGRLDETIGRLPLALSAVLALPLVLAIARTWLTRRAAWLSALVFGTCVNLMLQARAAQIDMLLVFLVALAMRLWLSGLESGKRAHVLLGYAAAGLATLAKGPAGLLPPLLSLVTFLLVSGQRQRLRELRLGSGLALWAAIVCAWLVPAVLVGGPAYGRTIVFQQNLGRYAEPQGHLQPWYYYLVVLPVTFFPWSVLLPSAVLLGCKRFRERERLALSFALSWVIVTVLFFSLSPGKRTVYVLTMYPGLALLVGAAIDHLGRDRGSSRRWLGIPLAVLALPLVAAVPLALALPRFANRAPEIAVVSDSLPMRAALTAAALALGATVGLALALARRPIAAFGALAAGSGVAGLLVALVVLPPFDPIKSARGLATIYRERAGPEEPYGMFPRLDPPFVYYTQRFATILRTPADLRAFAARAEPVWIFAEERYLRGVELPVGLIEVARDADPRSGFVLLTTRPLAPRDD
jgi:4-amino-4-deoxy-L-arabinose transferase-like glycosyltransferase